MMFLLTTDTRDMNDLLCAGLDTESARAESAPLFRAGCQVLSLGELETLISQALDAEFGTSVELEQEAA
jgi:hypothetical protein